MSDRLQHIMQKQMMNVIRCVLEGRVGPKVHFDSARFVNFQKIFYNFGPVQKDRWNQRSMMQHGNNFV